MPNKKTWNLYVLLKDGKPIYVGVTSNPINREIQHRKNKEFDNLYIIKVYTSKMLALSAENSIIRFNGLFDIGLSNAKHTSDRGVKLYLFGNEG